MAHDGELEPTDLDDLAALAARGRARDGGPPFASDPAFLRSRWLGEGVATRAHRDDGGRLLAAAALRPAGEGLRLAIIIDPSVGASADAAALLDWGLGLAGERRRAVTVETESLTDAQAGLFASRGLRQVFAEDVLRRDLADPVAAPVWPAGAVLHDWDAETAARFFAVYDAAFRERPGFPGDPAGTWIGGLEEDDEFRPGWSMLVELTDVGDAGFVTAAVGWVDQVGVIAEARGRGLGAALTAEALARMRADGTAEAWLTVNVDNPGARNLYLGLGFAPAGRRARFEA